MFVESLVETTVPRRSQRRWATLISFALQAAALCALLLAPIVFVGTLPSVHASAQTIGPPSHGFSPSRVELVRVPRSLRGGGLQQPGFIPTGIHQPQRSTPGADIAPDSDAGAAGEAGLPGVLPGTGDRSGLGSVALLMKPAITPPAGPARRLVISHLDNGWLVHQVDPIYPPLARAVHMQGQVLLAAIIDKDGNVDSLRVLYGQPLLAKAAADAVRQWRYRPYILNGQPCGVETQITVNFRLGE